MKKNLITCLLCLITIISYSACSNSVENSKETKQSSHTPEKIPEFSIIYDLAGGTNSPDNPEYYDSFELPIHLKSPSKEGFLFFAWVTDNNEIISEITTATNNPIKLKALWYEKGQAYFLVNYNLQDLENSSKYNLIQKEYLTGKVNSKTSITKRDYKGFTPQNIEQQNIKSDHTTVVNINYDRNDYDVHFIVSYDDRKDISEIIVSGKYMEELSIPLNQFDDQYSIDIIDPEVSSNIEENAYYNIYMKSKYEYFQRTDGKSIKIPFKCRDFRSIQESIVQNPTSGGYLTKELIDKFGLDSTNIGLGHPDFEPRPDSGNVILGMVKDTLGPDGLPVFNYSPFNTTETTFNMWYRDIPGINITVDKELDLLIGENNKISYEEGNIPNCEGFYPIDNEGFGNTHGYQHNYGFTDDLCFYILYNGKGNIRIIGDDDIWLFINGKLAIDLGGCHASTSKEIQIDGETTTKEINGTTYSYKYNSDFNIAEGQLVEVRIFHAERRATGSHFNLILRDLDVFERKLKE